MEKKFYSDRGMEITLTPISDADLGFLFELYAATRAEEMSMTGWGSEDILTFLKMQFELQHIQYMKNYDNPTFDLIMAAGQPVGRLYVNRGKDDLRIIDLALLPQFRRQGIARVLLESIFKESAAANCPVSLHVERENPIMEWYCRLGFKTVREVGIYYLMTRKV